MIFKPSKYEYRRNLPHYSKVDRPLFITFKTFQRWALPASAREIVFKSCLHFYPKLIDLFAAVVMPNHVHLVFKLQWHPNGEPVQLKEILPNQRIFGPCCEQALIAQRIGLAG